MILCLGWKKKVAKGGIFRRVKREERRGDVSVGGFLAIKRAAKGDPQGTTKQRGASPTRSFNPIQWSRSKRRSLMGTDRSNTDQEGK